jgi:hypothetical protein
VEGRRARGMLHAALPFSLSLTRALDERNQFRLDFLRSRSAI